MREPSAQRGFTLIELMVVIVLVGITAAIALPNFSRMIDSNRQAAAVNDMSGLLNFARSEAVKRNNPIAVYARNASDSGAGYAVCIQPALAACKAGTATAEQLLRTTNQLPGNVTISQLVPATAADLLFDRRGMASATFEYRICGEVGSDAIDININAGGQIRIDNATGVAC